MAIPFDAAADLREIVGEPGDAESPLAYATVTRRNPDTLAVLETAENVVALNWESLKAVVPAGAGEASAETAEWWLWAAGMAFAPKARDRVEDAAGVTWSVEGVRAAAFGGVYVCQCVRVRT